MSPRRTKATSAWPKPDALQRILLLEQRRGFDNHAAPGGTDRALLLWLEPAATRARSLGSRRRLAQLAEALRAYCDLDAPRRAQVIRQVSRELQRLVDPDVPPSLAAPVSVLRGIGPGRALSLSANGVHTLEDLLLLQPRSYLDATNPVALADLQPGQRAVVRVRIARGPQFFRGLRTSRVEAVAEDPTGQLLLVFFNQPWQAEKLRPRQTVVAVGRLRRLRERPAFVVERTIDAPDANCGPALLPVYRIADIPEKVIRAAVAQALELCADQVKPIAPPRAAAACGLLPRPLSLRALHRPDHPEQADLARRSLLFDQLLALQVRLLQHRARVRQPVPDSVLPVSGLADQIERLAGFRLTDAQRRVIAEVQRDLADELPAYRLIHGDVGCGKTVVAAAALLAAFRCGAQAAMMAPTEILAEQHAAALSRLLAPAKVPVHLLTGSLPRPARDRALAAAQAGRPGVWVGTHALISKSAQFRRLAVAIVDEQHRFGVAQRAALAAKGYRPNFFAVSATPIPRTLALALYADFDISLIDQLPPGRRPVETVLVGADDRPVAYEAVRRRVAAGQQAFVICPLIEPSETASGEAAVAHFERLRTGPLRGLRLGLVHGRLPTAQRQAVMEAFYAGEIHVLVSTTVIEVGLDVPNASVIVVESAERFGLAQLHQLRGRVARSRHTPVCILIASSTSPQATMRLRILAKYTDGLKIAEEDLRLRGPGDLAGLRQHGAAHWVAGDILRHPHLLAAARVQAEKILENDPELAKPEHAGLAAAVQALGQLEESRWAL